MPDPLLGATAALEFEMGVSGQAAMAGAASTLSNMASTLGRMIQNPLVGAGGGAMIGKNVERLVDHFKKLHARGIDINTIFSMIPWARVGSAVAGMAVSTGLQIAGAKEDAEDLNQAIQRAVAFDPEEDMGAWVETAWKMFKAGGEAAKRAFEDARDTILPYTRDLGVMERKQLAVNAAIMNMTLDPNASRDIVNMSVKMNMGLDEAARRYKDVAIRARDAEVPIREYFQIVQSITEGLYLYGVETDNVREGTLLFTQAIREGDLAWGDAAQTLNQLFTTQVTPQGMQQRLMQVTVLDKIIASTRAAGKEMAGLNALNEKATREYGVQYDQLNAIQKQYVLTLIPQEDYLRLMKSIVDEGGKEMGMQKEVLHLLFDQMGIQDKQRRTMKMMREDELLLPPVDPAAAEAGKEELRHMKDLTDSNRTELERYMQLMLGQTKRYSDIFQLQRSITEQIGSDMAQTLNVQIAIIGATDDIANAIKESYENVERYTETLVELQREREMYADITGAYAMAGRFAPTGMFRRQERRQEEVVLTAIQELIQKISGPEGAEILRKFGDIILHIDISDELRKTIRVEIERAMEGGH